MSATERLKHVAGINVSNVDKKTVEGEVTVRLCNYTDVYYNARISDDLDFMEATATPAQLREFGLRRGDILITKDSETADDIGIAALIESEMPNVVCGYHLAVIRPHPNRVHPTYLYWALTSTRSRQQLAVAATGVTRFGLRQDSIGNLQLRVPVFERQRAVADYLDAETARIDALLATKQRMIDLLGEWYEAWREQVLIGDEEVTWSPLYRLTDPARPIVYGIVQAGEEVPDGVPYIKTGDMADLRPEELSRTSHEIDETYRRARVRPGDIVIAMRASIGLPIMVPPTLPTANLTQGTARVAARDGVDARWLLEALKCRVVQEECSVRAVGTTFKTLNIWDLRRIRIPCPFPERQPELATKIGVTRDALDILLLRLHRQVDLMLEHRQALITAAVTGEIEIPGVAA